MIGNAFLETVEVLRQVLPGGFVDGRFIELAPRERLVFRASVQPASGDELVDQPEGERVRSQLKVYSDFELRTTPAVDGSLFRADRLIYNGRQYEVTAVARYTRVRPHFRAQVLEVLQPEDLLEYVP